MQRPLPPSPATWSPMAGCSRRPNGSGGTWPWPLAGQTEAMAEVRRLADLLTAEKLAAAHARGEAAAAAKGEAAATASLLAHLAAVASPRAKPKRTTRGVRVDG